MATITFKNPILLSELDENTNLETFYEINDFVKRIKKGEISGFHYKHLYLRGKNNWIKVYQKGKGETIILLVDFL